MPKISIIVPVYNVEKYIKRCIDSIIVQTYSDWELLLIDDGSPDRSGDICDEYARNDNRIKVFHTVNEGVSSARNLGLDNARGEYVTFIDSDDWIEGKCFEVCVFLMERDMLDILQFSFKRVDDNGNILHRKVNGTNVLSFEEYVKSQQYNVCVWGTFIRYSIIEKKHVRFDRKLKLAEDQVFIFAVMSCSDKLQSIPIAFYNYYFNVGSATNNTQIEDIMNSSEAMLKLKRKLPILTEHCDKMIVSFTMASLLKKDVDILKLSKMYKCADVRKVESKIFYEKIYVVLSKINVYAAVLIFRVAALVTGKVR